MKKIFFCLLIFFASFSLFGCTAAYLAGDIMRSQKKNVDLVIAQGVTLEQLQKVKKLAVNVNGINSSTGQYVFAMGQGSTNASIYSDMLTKEFMKMGYQASSTSENISETSSSEKLSDLASKGFEIVLVGNMNVSTTSSGFSYVTGGDYANTGVISFTVKGLDTKTGSVLFILSVEYGKAKTAGEVTKDLSELYRDTVIGKLKPSQNEE